MLPPRRRPCPFVPILPQPRGRSRPLFAPTPPADTRSRSPSGGAGMDTERGARAGGAFAWKTGAWFGAQVGSTLWLVVLGIVLSLRDDSSPGTAIIALAVAANGIGLLLWEHRDAIRPYPAIQPLIGVAACAARVAIVLIDGTSAWGLGGSE